MDREYRGRLEDGSIAEISGDAVDNCTLTQLLEKLAFRHFAHLSVANRQRAAAKLVSYNAYPYENPLEDPGLDGPCHPSKVNPRVPVLRISEPKDDKPRELCLRGPTPAQQEPAPNVASSKGTPSAAATRKPSRSDGDALPLSLTRRKAFKPNKVTKTASVARKRRRSTAQQAY